MIFFFPLGKNHHSRDTRVFERYVLLRAIVSFIYIYIYMDGVYFFSRWTRCTGIQFHRDWMVFESMQKNFSNRWKERTVSKLVFPGKLEIIKRCFTSFNRRGGIEATDDVARENRENVLFSRKIGESIPFFSLCKSKCFWISVKTCHRTRSDPLYRERRKRIKE